MQKFRIEPEPNWEDLLPDNPFHNMETAVLAGGCFWSIEIRFQRVIGVLFTMVGYTGGNFDYPCYKLICTG